jgi:predicted amidophosphoribosyltransferase
MNTPEQKMLCPVCDSPVEKNDKYCINCGNLLSGHRKKSLYCHVCVSPVEKDDEYCISCGSKLFHGNGKQPATVGKKSPVVKKQKNITSTQTMEKVIPLNYDISKEITEKAIPLKDVRSEEIVDSVKSKSAMQSERIIPVYSKLPKNNGKEITFDTNGITDSPRFEKLNTAPETVFCDNGHCPRCGTEIINKHYCIECLVLFSQT